MKKLLAVLPALALTLSVQFSASVSASSLPPQCNKTYTNTITVNASGQDVLGTAGNDLIYVNGNDNRVVAGAGDDCVVVNGTGNRVSAGAGNDVVYSTFTRNQFAGEAGNDYLQSGAYSYLSGGDGIDTCVAAQPGSFTASCEG